MNGYAGPELANAFRTVRKNTVQIAKDIPEDKYDFRAAPGTQAVGELLQHIAAVPMLYDDMHRVKRVTSLQGYDFPGIIGRITAEGKKTRSKTEIISLLEAEGERFATWLESLTPEFLAERVADPTGGAGRTRFESLLGAKEHEMHHRGQLMLIERILGIVPHLTRQREAARQVQSTAAAAAS